MKTLEAKIYTQAGKEAGSLALPEHVFGLSWNADLVHQVVTSMMTGMRTSVAHTKTRGEVRGGGKKPWQQKGTGRARHGSIRSPLWPGGGITHGPRNDQNYDRKINQKMKAKALFTVLSKKVKDGEIIFVDSMVPTEAKTKLARNILVALSGVKGFETILSKKKNSAFVATSAKNAVIDRSFRNFPNIKVNEVRNLNVLDLMNHKYVVIDNPKVSVDLIATRLLAKKVAPKTK